MTEPASLTGHADGRLSTSLETSQSRKGRGPAPRTWSGWRAAYVASDRTLQSSAAKQKICDSRSNRFYAFLVNSELAALYREGSHSRQSRKRLHLLP
jgi:hypothetical protein